LNFLGKNKKNKAPFLLFFLKKNVKQVFEKTFFEKNIKVWMQKITFV